MSNSQSDKINKHVERMHRYLPFSPQMEQVYEEYTISEDSMNLETKAFDYLLEAVNAKARVVVLTGDAGTWKNTFVSSSH